MAVFVEILVHFVADFAGCHGEAWAPATLVPAIASAADIARVAAMAAER
jgi:hypothetical protein